MKKNPEDISHQDILNVIKTSNQEVMDTILDAMNTFASHVDTEISGLKGTVGGLKSDVGSLKSDVGSLNSLKADIQYVKGVINTRMVTKDYLDEKFFKFEGKIGGWLHKEDSKVDALTGLLTEKKVLTKPEAKKIAQMGPFSKT